jgi:Protein of unknown function (DUF3237)
MITLVPLCTMTLILGKAVDAGNTPAGQRMAAQITSGEVSGRLNGTVAGAASSDWFTVTPGGLILPDVRLAIETGDGAVVLIRYAGRLLFVPGQESVAFTAPVFETGDPRYQWLNPVQAVGKGIMSADLSRIEYEVYELR